MGKVIRKCRKEREVSSEPTLQKELLQQNLEN